MGAVEGGKVAVEGCPSLEHPCDVELGGLESSGDGGGGGGGWWRGMAGVGGWHVSFGF